MNLDELTLGQVKELRSVFGSKITTNQDVLVTEVLNLVLQRGWVVVGRYTRKGQYVYLTDANIIRSWGTTKGLGELAFSGPTSDTKLDPLPELEAHILTVVLTTQCVGEKWEQKLR